MYKDGWIACARLDRIPWKIDPATLAKFGPGGGWDPDKDKWELYNIDEDFSQANDLAAKHPEKLAELKKLFWEEAEKYHVTPADGRARHLLRVRASRRGADEVHLLPRDREHRLGHDPARSTTARTRSPPTWTSRRAGPRG